MSDLDGNGGACALTIDDIEIIDNGEPRVHDLRLAKVLGFKQPRDIRKLIERHLKTLERLGGVCATVAQTSAKGGRPAQEYWLTKRQAAFLTTSRKPNWRSRSRSR
ncbi:hypothetical protein WCLP8_3650002 [uncultured Gammaproteobacteria bacterium]